MPEDLPDTDVANVQGEEDEQVFGPPTPEEPPQMNVEIVQQMVGDLWEDGREVLVELRVDKGVARGRLLQKLAVDYAAKVDRQGEADKLDVLAWSSVKRTRRWGLWSRRGYGSGFLRMIEQECMEL